MAEALEIREASLAEIAVVFLKLGTIAFGGPALEIREASLAEIAVVFLKLGTIAFGGPAAHLAMMEEEFVRRRRWITQAEFLDRMAAAHQIPGPSSRSEEDT